MASKKNPPNNQEGKDGDLLLALDHGVNKLYGKIDKEWYSFGNAKKIGYRGRADLSESAGDDYINNLDIAKRLTLRHILQIGSDTDKFLMSDSGIVKYVTGANLLTYAGGQAALTFGIANTNAVKIDHASVADNDYAKFTANGLEGRSYSEVASDINSSLPITALNNATANELVTVGATTTELDAESGLTFDGNTLNVTNTSGLANALKISYDGSNYGYLNTASNGSLSIGNAGTDASLTLAAATNLTLTATGGEILLRKGTTFGTFDFDTSSHLKLIGTSNYDVSIIAQGSGDMTIDATGNDVFIKDNLKLNEIADATADTAAHGQIWVHDTTPNELCFTDDAGTDIIGIGKYHYESKIANFYTSVLGNFIPLAGYVIEKTSVTSNNEFIAMVAPYNGTIEKILWRSEQAQDGTIEMDIYESPEETEVPGTVTGTKDTLVDRINDDMTQDVSFASMTSGTNALVKGRIYAIKITTPSVSNDTNVTVVFKWDITS